MGSGHKLLHQKSGPPATKYSYNLDNMTMANKLFKLQNMKQEKISRFLRVDCSIFSANSKLKRGHNSIKNQWFVTKLFKSVDPFMSYRPDTVFWANSKLKRGHNSVKNWWFVTKVELDLYFMVLYPCTKYYLNPSTLS